MGTDAKGGAARREAKRREEHVVFDFTGLDRPDVSDLSLILTARLQSGPTGHVWVRSLPRETARILEALRLDHLFRAYPRGSDQLH
jgi:anti-anti-sigma regulatory factor